MSYALLRKDGCAKIASERLALIDRLLIEGIRIGSVSKRRAINKVLREFPEFTRGDCWQRIRYLRKNPGAGSLRVCQCDRVTSVSKTGPNRRPVARQWTEADDDKLLNLAGYERVDKIGQRLSRSVRAVRFRLCARHERESHRRLVIGSPQETAASEPGPAQGLHRQGHAGGA